MCQSENEIHIFLLEHGTDNPISTNKFKPVKTKINTNKKQILT